MAQRPNARDTLASRRAVDSGRAHPRPWRALKKQEVTRADFERYFPYTPAALCVKECARLSALRKYACPGPILDVGCGDGLFASIAFEGAEVWGIDIDAEEGRWAAASQAYSQIILGDVTRARLPNGFFATCVANCSLEHVPRIDRALENIRSSLAPGGRAYLFVPNKDWARDMLSYRTLAGLGLEAAAELFRSSVDTFFKHHHLHDRQEWQEIVSAAGMKVVAIEPALSTGTTVAFELLLLPSLAGWLNKQMTTRWTNFPPARRLFARPVHELVARILDASSERPSAEFLIVAERSA
ncbi:MAG TPA: class I SAM-dependent methyltransferase [Polyangiaceae bacterium]|nr:class I SAM-dependent methyltransferase [Polyangiaceae bacterium]